MTAFTVTRRVNARADRVFALFTSFQDAPRHIPTIERVEMLTAGPVRAGTRFRETRALRGRRTTVEMEVTRFEPGEGYAVACESHGCRLSSACLITPDGDGTKVDVVLDVEPRGLLSRWKIRLLLPAIRREFERDLDALKAAAEAG